LSERICPLTALALTPIARFWLRLKADYFTARTPEQLAERLLTALKAFIDDPKTVASQCATRK
jgi:hypothetical protein